MRVTWTLDPRRRGSSNPDRQALAQRAGVAGRRHERAAAPGRRRRGTARGSCRSSARAAGPFDRRHARNARATCPRSATASASGSSPAAPCARPWSTGAVRDEQDRPEVARRIERNASTLPSRSAVTVKPPRSAAAALSGWPSIAVGELEGGSAFGQRFSPASALPATSPPTVAAADEPRPRGDRASAFLHLRPASRRPSGSVTPSEPRGSVPQASIRRSWRSSGSY